jgi:hypothetical protein
VTAATPEPQPAYAVVELMGHVTIIGKVSEATLAGAPVVRIERLDGRVQHVGAASLYRVTECTLDEARMAHQHEQAAWYGPIGLPSSLAHAVMAVRPAIGAGDDDEDYPDPGDIASLDDLDPYPDRGAAETAP